MSDDYSQKSSAYLTSGNSTIQQPTQISVNPPVPQPPTTPTPTNTPNPPSDLKDPLQSQVAKKQKRDVHGHFIKSDTTSEIPAEEESTSSHGPSFLPPVVEINQNVEPSKKDDPPLFNLSITNPVTYLKKFLDKLIKRQAITIRIPVLAILIIIVGAGGFGLGYNRGVSYTASKLFPDSSPILRRPITKQGVIQKSTKGYLLKVDSNLWELKPQSTDVQTSLANHVGKPALVKGNLTPDSFVIDVSEVVSY